MDTGDLRLIRRMAPLMPLSDPITQERVLLDRTDFFKIVTFIVTRPIEREVAFYYLLKHNVVDYIKVFSVEELISIYFNHNDDYKSLEEIRSPVFLVILGKEVFNAKGITILNNFVDYF